MARKAPRRSPGESSGRETAKVTLTLEVELVQRLGVAASMRRVSMSAVAAEILGPPLRRWRLPSSVDAPAAAPGVGDGAGQGGG